MRKQHLYSCFVLSHLKIKKKIKFFMQQQEVRFYKQMVISKVEYTSSAAIWKGSDAPSNGANLS